MKVEEIVMAVNAEMNKTLKVNAMSKGAHCLLRLFIPGLRELYEMRYQTPFSDAMRTTVLSFKTESE